MEQYIKEYIRDFFKNLKKYWVLGIVFVLISVVFVVVSSMMEMKANSDVQQGVQPVVVEETKQLVGIHSMSMIEWKFEEKENSELYEVELELAKENLKIIVEVVGTGDFRNEINKMLESRGCDVLNSEDVVYFTAKSYNVIDVKIFGYDSEKLEIAEELIRTEINKLATELYDIDSIKCISNPILLNAQVVDDVYYVESTVYEKNVKSEEQTQIQQTTQTEQNILLYIMSLRNIVVVLSSVALYMVIVLLITIARDEKYTDKE